MPGDGSEELTEVATAGQLPEGMEVELVPTDEWGLRRVPLWDTSAGRPLVLSGLQRPTVTGVPQLVDEALAEFPESSLASGAVSATNRSGVAA